MLGVALCMSFMAVAVWHTILGRGVWYAPCTTTEMRLAYPGCYRLVTLPTDRLQGIEVRIQARHGYPIAYPISVVCVPRTGGLSRHTQELVRFMTEKIVYVTYLPGEPFDAVDVYLELGAECEPPSMVRIDSYAVFGLRKRWIGVHGGFEDLRAPVGGPA